MTGRDFIGLIHLAGFLTGVALYGMLASMSWRGARRRDGAWMPADRITMSAAVLGLVWNAGALLVFGSQDFGFGALSPWVAMVSYAALGFLPAVVVDAATRKSSGSGSPSRLALASYLLSAVATVLLARSTLTLGTPTGIGLRTLTIGYGALLLVLALTSAKRRDARRVLTVVALAAFAVSALHLSGSESANASWVVELIGHHASLPLVLVILYQDYRFALADLFLKRALAVLVLVAAVVTVYGLLNHGWSIDGRAPLASPAVLVAAWVGTALLYPWLWKRVDAFVDRVILRRADYRALRAELTIALAQAETADEALAIVTKVLGRALNAHRVTLRERDGEPHERTLAVDPLVALGAPGSATVTVPTAEAPAYELTVDDLADGRRLLSDDVAFLDAVALLVARRIDELRVARERYARDLRETEMQRLAAEAELRALRAQLNPHFLFNALTTIGYLVRSSPPRALDTLFQLTTLLRAALRRIPGEFLPLRDELQFVDAYLAIEQARFEDRLRVERDIAADLLDVPVPPLILQPLVENAIKHGIAPRRAGGTVRIVAERTEAGGTLLHLRVADSGPGVPLAELEERRRAGVGLSNIERRLAHYFGDGARLDIASTVGVGTTVDLHLPLGDSSAAVTASMIENTLEEVHR